MKCFSPGVAVTMAAVVSILLWVRWGKENPDA